MSGARAGMRGGTLRATSTTRCLIWIPIEYRFPRSRGPARYARGSWTERFAISTTIRTTSSTQSKRFVYRRGDLGKTDVYLGQRDRRWNAVTLLEYRDVKRDSEVGSRLNWRLIRRWLRKKESDETFYKRLINRELFLDKIINILELDDFS